MGASVNAYIQIRATIDALAESIGQFDVDLINRDQRALLHASAAPSVVILMALLNKGVITVDDLTSARAAAVADPAWPSVVEQ